MTGKVVDLRADTFCRPTPGMREAMSQAGLGDDLFGENPTVNDLQDRAASLFGKEAALFVASGTMANQIAIKVYTQPGEEVICDAGSHPIHSELAAAGMISGVQFRLLNGDRGIFSREDAEDAIRPDSPLFRPDRPPVARKHPQPGRGADIPSRKSRRAPGALP